jgi:hypothetical protein
MANPRGIPTLPSALIRPTTPPEPGEPVAEVETAEGTEPAEGQGRGAAEPRPAAPSRTTRKRRPAAEADKASKRGLYLPDSLWERLQYEAIRKKTSVSAIAIDHLNRSLPRFKVEREG